MRSGLEPHPRPVGHPLSINGEGGRRPRCGRNVFGEGEDARVAGVYGFGEGDGHLPTADVRYLARGTFGMVGLGRLGSPALHDTIAR